MRKTKTAQQRKAEVEQLHATLVEKVEQLRNGDQWAAFLRFAAAFHSYSFRNTVLIFAQAPDASHVAGYRAWQKLGRQVRKGERGIRILGTGTKKITDATGDDDQADEAGRTVRYFFPVSVFDIAQTDPIEGQDVMQQVMPERLSGADDAQIYQRTADHLQSLGVTIARENIEHGANGYTEWVEGYDPESSPADRPLRIVIQQDLEPAHAAKTIVHEAAHITLGHLANELEEYQAHRGRCEVEAESVAYVVAAALGLDSSRYSVRYVAGWAQTADSDVLQATAAAVHTAAGTLATALTAS